MGPCGRSGGADVGARKLGASLRQLVLTTAAAFSGTHVTDTETLRFWQEELPSYSRSLLSEAVAPILNKVGQIAASQTGFLTNHGGAIAPNTRGTMLIGHIEDVLDKGPLSALRGKTNLIFTPRSNGPGGPRLTRLVGLTRARGLWRIRRRLISISRLSDRRRGGPAAW